MNPATEHSNPDRSRSSVLVIEDEQKTYEGWLTAFRARGVAADIAANPDEAVARLGSHAYSVVILDLMLPLGANLPDEGRDKSWDVGIELLRRIRVGEFAPTGTKSTVPVLVVTSVSRAHVSESIEALEPTRIYTKPESPYLIAEHTRILLEEHEQK